MRLARLPFLHRAGLPGWSRTSGLRLPGPAGWPSPPQAGVNAPRSGQRSSPRRCGRDERPHVGLSIAPSGMIDAPAWAGSGVGVCRLACRQRCCSCHSPTLRPWIAVDRWRPAWRGAGARASHRVCRTAEGLSLSGGASVASSVFQAEHHLFVVTELSTRTKKGDPSGSPSPDLPMHSRSSARSSRRGSRTRSVRADRASAGTASPNRPRPLGRRDCGC